MTCNPLTSLFCGLGLTVAIASPAWGVVTDNFESYTVGQDSTVANPTRYESYGLPTGVIAAGTATANVASSNVLEQVSTGSPGVGTRVIGTNQTGTVNLSMDFRTTDFGTNIYIQDGGTADLGLIRILAGNSTLFYLSGYGSGSTGSNNTYTEALLSYGDWYRLNVALNIDTANALNNSYSYTVDNLTTGTNAVVTSAVLNFLSANVVQVNRLQLEQPTGNIQLDNFNVVPEPGSLALLALGGAAMLARRRAR